MANENKISTAEQQAKNAKTSQWLNYSATLMNYTSGLIKQPENGKYSLENTREIEGITGQLGPWGAAFTALSDLGFNAANAYGGGVDKYGLPTNKGKYEAGAIGSAIFKPWDTNKAMDKQMDYLTPNEKKQFLNTQGGRLIGGFLAPWALGAQKTKNQNAIGQDMKMADEIKIKREKEYENSQKRLNYTKSNFATAVNSASSYYNGLIGTAKNGGILHKFNLFEFKTNKKKLIFAHKKGGSVIVEGAYHHTTNKLGDKGIPVVTGKGIKVFEVEKKELITNSEFSLDALALVEEYNRTKNENILNKLGDMFETELLDNTFSYIEDYNCLNNNTCLIK